MTSRLRRSGYETHHGSGVPVVGIGASAGGLRALEAFFGNLPPHTGMAYVVILHLDPHHESQLPVLLQAHTAMPVRQITQSVTVEPDHVYVIPPDRNLLMDGGEVCLVPRAASGHARTPIDLFFRTLAETRNADAIGVVLSGTGSDGTQGVRWIKEHGGITMAQARADAEFDGMPRSAIATGQVDVVLPAADLAAELARVRHAASSIALPGNTEELQRAESSALGTILGHVQLQTGQDFTGYKPATVLRRLERRMQFTGRASLADYAIALRASPDETRSLFNDFLITVTSFFRDPSAFEALERETVPALFATKGPEDDVRVWVAGCATGEEAYSLAMLLCEHVETLAQPPQIQIFATDVHEQAFTFAREGLYPESIAADVSPARLERFFSAEPGGYRVKKALREMVLFTNHNLLSDPPFLRLDLVSCRNVLIYLQRGTQRRVLERFNFALRPGAHLFLGGSESTDAAPELFGVIDGKHHVFRSIPSARAVAFAASSSSVADRSPSALSGSHRSAPFSFGALHQQLVEAYAPPSLVVNADGEVVHVSNHAGRFLTQSGGEPSHKLLDMVQDELRRELRSLIRAAFRTGKPTETRRVATRVEGKVRHVDVSVRPLPASEGSSRFALVILDEQRGKRPPKPDRASVGRRSDIDRLEEELKETAARLAVTSEEHEATIEALRASNEELQSISEEQRAVSEELESSKEELQSTNEELRRINQERRVHNEVLTEVNSDLINLINSTDIGTVFLDRKLCIRRYTPQVAPVFNFVDTDVGRPLSHVTNRLDYPDLESDARAVLESLDRREREVTSRDGRWFVVRLAPYRSVDDRIDGVVLTLIDTTDRKHAELERETLLKLAQSASTAKSNFIAVMSHEFRTPLNAVLGYADIMQAGAAGPMTVVQRGYLERIVANVRHLGGMVEREIAAARGDNIGTVPEFRPIDLSALVRGSASAIESVVSAKGLTLRVEVPDVAIPISTDATKLHQVIINLLGNAARYTDTGEVAIRARVEGDTAIVEVQDTGIGIAPEHLQQIFERFWQVDQGDSTARGGSGLGLMVSRDLARALGGDIEVESEVGRGSLFRVRLPRAGAAAAPALARPRSEPVAAT